MTIWNNMCNSEDELAKELCKVEIPSEKARQEISKLAKILGVNENINILIKSDLLEVSYFMYMLGREDGKRSMNGNK